MINDILIRKTLSGHEEDWYGLRSIPPRSDELYLMCSGYGLKLMPVMLDGLPVCPACII